MELSTLKRMRKVVPGTVFLIFAGPMLYRLYVLLAGTDELSSVAIFLAEAIGVVVVFAIGTLIDQIKYRNLIIGTSYQAIDENIKTKLLSALPPGQYPNSIEEVKSSRRLKNIFYHFIDSDASLREKSKNVKDNGLIWTSCGDVALIALVFAPAYFLLYLVLGYLDFLLMFCFIVLLGVIARFVVFPKAVADHIELGNEQLDTIFMNYKEELKDKLVECFTDETIKDSPKN